MGDFGQNTLIYGIKPVTDHQQPLYMDLIWPIKVFYGAEGLWIGLFEDEFNIDRLYYV